MANEIIQYTPNEEGVVIYRAEDNTLQLDVQLANNTVWLTQQQMTVLFDTTKQNISLHINNIFREGELSKDSVVKDYLTTAADGKSYRTLYYNLDVIISVGYRVKSKRGTQFRQWATKVLNEYMIRGYAANQRLLNIENQLAAHQKQLAQHQEKIEFFVRTNQTPVEQVFFGGEFFAARVVLEKLIKTAQHRVIIIDRYVDASTFEMLDVRQKGVTAAIYSEKDFRALRDAHNATVGVEPIDTFVWGKPSHDRWLIIDDTLYHCGHSLKDMGQKLSAISLMGTPAQDIIDQIK
jgi:hypothetical protein